MVLFSLCGWGIGIARLGLKCDLLALFSMERSFSFFLFMFYSDACFVRLLRAEPYFVSRVLDAVYGVVYNPEVFLSERKRRVW